MPKVKINGVDIHYILEGEGEEVLVILNGIMMSANSWRDFVPTYVERGYRVLRVDFRDQGQSGSSPDFYPTEQHAEDLKGLLDYLNLKKVNIYGISYGGRVAMIFAIRYQSYIKNLILANTTCDISNLIRSVGLSWEEAAKAYDGAFFLKIIQPFIYSHQYFEQSWDELKKQPEYFDKILDKEWFDRYIRLSRSGDTYDVTDQLGQITVPTLVILSEDDMVTPYADMIKIHEGIKGSNFISIPNCGHGSFAEKPGELNTLILGFLALHK
ncbi:alpha/beta hydrolase [Serpentinicella sp. ANB-PHB4]|uniref:alpha/beta fold hydrolase n=1 Tax=Serpentinicella sp. ANB-PHB4 TaxID=3074076 RepID=UPI00285CF115|nr:alpha/beta hydrolase [Serpentinicella sp. ANB-PHB4]MDR5659924.1 alpha/beta hydrolase [Serpentinicella sp. ANB-PHB4]